MLVVGRLGFALEVVAIDNDRLPLAQLGRVTRGNLVAQAVQFVVDRLERGLALALLRAVLRALADEERSVPAHALARLRRTGIRLSCPLGRGRVGCGIALTQSMTADVVGDDAGFGLVVVTVGARRSFVRPLDLGDLVARQCLFVVLLVHRVGQPQLVR